MDIDGQPEDVYGPMVMFMIVKFLLHAQQECIQIYSINASLTEFFKLQDPTNYYTFEFLKEFFTEIAHVFPDYFVHNGGDEVYEPGALINCW